jgi:hypothetical protein
MFSGSGEALGCGRLLEERDNGKARPGPPLREPRLDSWIEIRKQKFCNKHAVTSCRS